MKKSRTAFTEPIPADGRLVRAVRRHQEHTRNAKLLAQLARETGGNVAAERERHITRRNEEQPDPVDLRGIPVVGKGIAGVSPGTRPDAITDRET